MIFQSTGTLYRETDKGSSGSLWHADIYGRAADTGGDGGACKRKEEDMVKITYISHSCFAVELEHSVLVFDYYQGELPLWNPEKTIYVFVSHRHYDHFPRKSFGGQSSIRRLNTFYPMIFLKRHMMQVRFADPT